MEVLALDSAVSALVVLVLVIQKFNIQQGREQ
jgi:hypothetical protein